MSVIGMLRRFFAKQVNDGSDHTPHCPEHEGI